MDASCFASLADNATVLKGYEIWVNRKRRSYYPYPCKEALEREALVYKHLGEHPQILQCFGLEEVHPSVHLLRLELAPQGNVRRFIEEHANYPPPKPNYLQIALDVATGLSHVHLQNVRHSDLSCRNLFLFDGYCMKISDFSASTLDGYKFADTICEDIEYKLPCRGREFNDQLVMKRELFALGSAIYKIMAWIRLFKGLKDKEVEARYTYDEFPLLDSIIVSPIISNCWNELYNSADDIVASLKQYFI